MPYIFVMTRRPHWLIETTHLVIGFGALAFIGTIGECFMRRKATAVAVSTNGDAARQA
jgi:hypothetical protein